MTFPPALVFFPEMIRRSCHVSGAALTQKPTRPMRCSASPKISQPLSRKWISHPRKYVSQCDEVFGSGLELYLGSQSRLIPKSRANAEYGQWVVLGYKYVLAPSTFLLLHPHISVFSTKGLRWHCACLSTLPLFQNYHKVETYPHCCALLKIPELVSMTGNAR